MSEIIAVAQLATLEDEAGMYLEAVKVAWIAFTGKLLEIKRTKVWRDSGYPNYKTYIRERWIPVLPFGESRIRQLEAAYDTAQMIKDIVAIDLNENQVRILKSIVPSEHRRLLAEIVSRTFASKSNPAKRHFQATYDVLLEREQSATVTVDGESIHVDTTQASVLEAVYEADMRQKDYIASGSKWQTVNRYEVTPDSGITVAGIQLKHNQQILIIVRELKQDATPVAEGEES